MWGVMKQEPDQENIRYLNPNTLQKDLQKELQKDRVATEAAGRWPLGSQGLRISPLGL